MLFKFALIAVLMAFTYAATNDDSTMYIINQARYDELLSRVKGGGLTETKITFIQSATGLFAFSCKQAWELANCCSSSSDKLLCLEALKSNIHDPQNKEADIISKGFSSSDKANLANLLANLAACKTEGIAPEKFPTLQLPYTSQWTTAEFNTLINDIKSTTSSDAKLALAINTILARSNGLSSTQVIELYKNIPFTTNLVKLSEKIKDRIMGVTCAEIVGLLKTISMSNERLEVLKVFKTAITDVENKFSVLDAWTMSGDKEAARKILADLRPRSFIFGAPSGKVVFLLDYSGSMTTGFNLNTGKRSTRIDFVKAEFAKTASALNEADTKFDVFVYAERVLAWKPNLQVPKPEPVAQAIAFTRQYPANGGTNIYEALRVAWNTPEVESIYLLTDGSPSVGKTNVDTILAEVKQWNAKTPIKINTIAFLMGTERWDNKPASRSLMKALADATQGTYRSIESDQ